MISLEKLKEFADKNGWLDINDGEMITASLRGYYYTGFVGNVLYFVNKEMEVLQVFYKNSEVIFVSKESKVGDDVFSTIIDELARNERAKEEKERMIKKVEADKREADVKENLLNTIKSKVG
jgi:hypothetical protein